MPSFYGIAPDDSGAYTLVSLHLKKSGPGRVRIRRWSIHNKFQTFLLLHRVAVCGLPVSWRPASEASDTPGLTPIDDDGRFKPYGDPAIADMHAAALRNNCSAMIGSDAFLCTLPLYFADASIPSFISVFIRKDYCEFGVIRDKKLIAVFKMAPGLDTAVEGHLGRLRRYWVAAVPLEPFPERVYVLGGQGNLCLDGFSAQALTIKIRERTLAAEDELRALGLALVGLSGSAPSFPCAKVEKGVRAVRTAAILGGAALIVAAALCVLSGSVMRGVGEWKLKKNTAQYSRLFAGNREMQTLQRGNDSLARAVIGMQKKSARQTQWGRFLEALGASRPVNLYFDKLGSENVKESTSQVRVALSGTAKNETLVTDLMARLKKSPPVVGVSLSYLEKNEKNKSLCDFRIICVVMISTM
jgi:hypothetical protein